jgi:hypothetical protein
MFDGRVQPGGAASPRGCNSRQTPAASTELHRGLEHDAELPPASITVRHVNLAGTIRNGPFDGFKGQAPPSPRPFLPTSRTPAASEVHKVHEATNPKLKNQHRKTTTPSNKVDAIGLAPNGPRVVRRFGRVSRWP